MSITLFELDQRFVNIVKKIEDADGIVEEQLEKEYDNICFELLFKEENYIKIVEHFDSQIELGKKIIDRINSKLRIYKSRQDRLKKNLIISMQARDIETAETELGKIRLQQSESVRNLPLSEYPEIYIKTRVIEEIDKVKLKKDCKDNPELAEKFTLSISSITLVLI